MSTNTEGTAVIAERTSGLEKCRDGSRSGVAGGSSRRMRLLQRMGCFGSASDTIRIERATSVADLCSAFKLVHDKYVEAGYIREHRTGMRARKYDTLLNTATFVAKDNDVVVGVTSVIPDSKDLGLPSDEVFHDRIEHLRNAGRMVCEGSNWVVAPEYRRSGVLNELMRASFAYAYLQWFDDWIVAVSPGHAAFFFDFLGFETLGDERNYSKDLDDPVILARLALDGLDNRFKDVPLSDDTDEGWLKKHYVEYNSYYTPKRSWDKDAENTFKDPNTLQTLFVDRTGLLADLTDDEWEAVEREWGPEIFLQVREYYNKNTPHKRRTEGMPQA